MDLDRTLLDFDASEANGLTHCFAEIGVPLTEEIRNFYIARNHALWGAFEKGEIPRDEIFAHRFHDTFLHFGIDADGDAMEVAYRKALSTGADLMPYAIEAMDRLVTKYDLYAATNGVGSTQVRRVQDSGLKPYFKDVFISEEVGAQKPELAFFNHCFSHIPNFVKEDALMIGDSLPSDIQGGILAGIDTCWFNFHKEENKTPYQPTYEVCGLLELCELLDV
ncbi:YjjG family noncanonical pyrimidine nucleotidase [Chakrabartyella piscis]|uniref:YjjG family noncanonical pyrimidine nucleotidase n=1 Tax=Chakrabartyella piscis TaxID=2918914 RepID=UPI00295886A3|nr:YjjG family noncanonical pyrimidine nucleotidase [Chakrabartyella piscis]